MKIKWMCIILSFITIISITISIICYIAYKSTESTKNVMNENEIKTVTETATLTPNPTELPQNKETDVFLDTTWEVKKPPVYQSDKWFDYNNGSEYKVIKAGNKIATTDYKYYAYTTFEPEDDSGLLIGLDRGEFGGGLFFLSTDEIMAYLNNSMLNNATDSNNLNPLPEGTAYCINQDNTNGFYELNGEYYCFGGYNHGMTNVGDISHLYKKDEKWYSEDYLDLPEAPRDFYIDGQDVYILTSSKIVLVRDGKISIVIENSFWNGLSPNTIIKIDNTLYVGVRGGVASYNLTTKKSTWFEPSKKGKPPPLRRHPLNLRIGLYAKEGFYQPGGRLLRCRELLPAVATATSLK